MTAVRIDHACHDPLSSEPAATSHGSADPIGVWANPERVLDPITRFSA